MTLLRTNCCSESDGDGVFVALLQAVGADGEVATEDVDVDGGIVGEER